MSIIFQKLISLLLSAAVFLSAGTPAGGPADAAKTIAGNEYDCAGYELTFNILSKSYNLFNHKTRNRVDTGGTAAVWPAAYTGLRNIPAKTPVQTPLQQ